MSTTVYFPNTGDAEVSPPFHSTWDVTTGADRRLLVPDLKSGTAFSEKVTAEATATGDVDVLSRQYVSQRMAAQTFDSFMIGIIRMRESDAAANMRTQVVIRVVSEDGQTDRGVLLAARTGVLAAELVATTTPSSAQSRWLPFDAGGAAQNLSSVSVQDQDRLVIEIGSRAHNSVATSYNLGVWYGDNAASDHTVSNSTSQLNPIIYFDHTISWYSDPPLGGEKGWGSL